MPYGMGPWGWSLVPYAYPYSGWGRCRWFPWLPRWWWTGMYGSVSPYFWPMSPYYGQMMPPMSKDDEIQMLGEEAKVLEQELDRIKKRLEELKKVLPPK